MEYERLSVQFGLSEQCYVLRYGIPIGDFQLRVGVGRQERRLCSLAIKYAK
jgi:hypothetical protein